MLRSADRPLSEFQDVLRDAGYFEEALTLGDADLIEHARELVELGCVLTGVDDAYPRRWLERLGEGAPPALWLSGAPILKPLVGIVGSREIDLEARKFAESIGREAVRLGFAVLSGGATGSDLAGAKGALLAKGQVLEVVPYGIDRYVGVGKTGASLCVPDEEFSSASAMERNTLIYAGAEATVIVASRFKQGGTWMGAFEAIRKKTGTLIVRDDGSQSSRALIGLGAIPIEDPTTLGTALQTLPQQRGLFGIG
ncbi:MAG: DNA-processing protein DprA [Fimbriimonas sp.]|nr:DNA-processing protein DprA [Fimbriimonas sp.]